MKKVLLVATVQSHICQFHRPLVEMLHEHGCEVHVAARDNLAEKNGLKLDFVEKVFDVPFQRSPFSLRNIKAYKMLKKIIHDGEYDVINCNTPVGGILTRMAAKKARKRGTKVIYTVHGFHFYNGAPKKYWLFYPLEKYLANRYTDLLITINQEDYERAKKNFKCPIEHIYGVGVRSERYHPASKDEQKVMREKENLADNDFVILCTKELMFDNNQKTILLAVNKIKAKIPGLRMLFAGNGPDEQMLKKLANDLGLANIVRFLGYRTDLEQVVPAVDLVVSCSWREGMPLNIIEAMLCARPIIASHNRGHDELIEDGKTGFLIDKFDVDGLADRIIRIKDDTQLAERFGRRAFEKAQMYTAKSVVEQMRVIIDTIGRSSYK